MTKPTFHVHGYCPDKDKLYMRSWGGGSYTAGMNADQTWDFYKYTGQADQGRVLVDFLGTWPSEAAFWEEQRAAA